MNLKQLAVCVGGLAIFFTTNASAVPAYVTTTVNLRSGPGVANEIVGRIPAGSLVDANNCANGWCEVAWQGKNGFAIQTAIDTSGRVPNRYGPPVVYQRPYVVAPPRYYGPAYDYPPPYYYRPYRRWYW
jgi:uncharacterized protein YraI